METYHFKIMADSRCG